MVPENRFDVTLALQNFMYADGILYKRLTCGTLRELTVIEQGKLVVTVAGVKYLAADVAWAIAYRNWPKYSVLVLGTNPKDMALENLVAVRNLKHRLRITETAGRFYHPLSLAGFNTPEAATKAWNERVADRYIKDMPMVLQIEAAERELHGDMTDYAALAQHKKQAKVKQPYVKQIKPETERLKPLRPPKPRDVFGMTWLMLDGAWFSTPDPVHPSDDWKLRCAAIKNGAKRFAYDKALGVTVPYHQ